MKGNFFKRSSWSPGGDFWMWAIKLKKERGRLERFALHMTLFMQKIQEWHGLFMKCNLKWGGKKTVSKGWLPPGYLCQIVVQVKKKRALIWTREVKHPSQLAVTPQMQRACISAAAAVAAVVSSMSESVEPPRLRPVCSAPPWTPQQKCLQPLCATGAPSEAGR